MSYNPYAFDQYASTPTTPTSAYPWETMEQPRLDLAAPQAQLLQPQAQAQGPPLFDLSQVPPPQLRQARVHLSEPLSAGGLSSVRAGSVPADAVEGTGPGVQPTVIAATQSLTGSSSVPFMPDFTRPASAMSTISLRPVSRASSGARGPGGPVRTPRIYGSAEGVHGTHPYRRTSGGASAAGVASGNGARGTTPRQSPEASVPPVMMREPPQPANTLRFVHYQQPKAPLPSATTMGCPAGGSRRAAARASSLVPTTSNASQQHDHAPFAPSNLAGPSMTPSTSTNPAPAPSSLSPTSIPPHAPTPAAPRPSDARARVFHLRADVHYDPPSRIMTVTMEVPGVRKADLRVTLQRCPYSRVKQLTVSGTTAPVFPDESVGYCLRERRFGDFVRTLALPPDTMRDDVFADIADGVLTIKVPVGPPSAPEEADEIALR